MATAQSYPVPIGTTQSFSPVTAGNTATFAFPEGYAVVTFQPVDVNKPGVATLYDSAATSIFVMSNPGHYELMVPPGGASYYFNTTIGANLLAMTHPSIMR
ncbi:MAG: hypothetical protein ACRDRB_20805 [Pseudonocardiaceae bacterium]